MIHQVHGTFGSPLNIGTLTGKIMNNTVYLTKLELDVLKSKFGASEVKVFAHKMATLK